MIPNNEKGYILLECLISLFILSTLVLTLIQTLPLLIDAKHRIETEKIIYNTLYLIYDQQTFYDKIYPDSLHYTTPVPYTIKPNELPLCAIYSWRLDDEKKICF